MARRDVSALVWGVLSILAGALMTEGGIMEVVVYGPQGITSEVVVGALGALSSAVLLVSGVAFCTRRSFGRPSAIAAAIAMAPVHFTGWLLGIVGVPGALLGVVYPLVLLAVLRAKPNLGAPARHESSPGRTGPPGASDNARQRIALAHG